MTEFLKTSKSIVTDFLSTAVFLDDQATFINTNSTGSQVNDDQKTDVHSKTQEEKQDVPQVINDPTTGEKAILQTTSNVTEQVTPEPTELNTILSDTNNPTASSDSQIDDEHKLDAQTIINTFMEKGIVCSVIKCEKTTYSTQKSNYIKLMKKADIIVLDWDLFKDGGENVLEILTKMTSADESHKELRSILIYTANDLGTVKERLKSIRILFDEDSYISHNNLYTTVSLWNKKSKEATPDRTAKFEDMVDKCIDEFTETFHGIVPNVAMAAIAEIRKNTHKILGVLNKSLDPAYLSHRALQTYPKEAENHLEEIIVNELASIVYGHNVGQKSNYEILKDYPNILGKKYDEIDLQDCLKIGLENLLDTSKKNRLTKSFKKKNFCFTKIWNASEPESIKSEKDFALLSLVQTIYTNNPKSLTLGVVIEKQIEGHEISSKLLCLQPRCDSTRLDEKTDFLFLELKELKESEVRFDLFFNEEDKKYKVVYNKEARKNISFASSINKVVESKGNIFTDTNDIKYKFISTLKDFQAQRIANSFGTYISRIGLNESEYLRRNRP